LERVGEGWEDLRVEEDGRGFEGGSGWERV
jgi:hypothetical protein